MARLIAALVRHGDYQQLADTPSAHQPFPLNRKGENQARQGAQLLIDTVVRNHWVPLPSIDSSRMLRAWQTAVIFAERLAELVTSTPSVESHDALAERGVGCLANLTLAQIESVLQQDPRVSSPPADWKADSHYRLPLQGAESLMEAGERVAGHLERTMASLPATDQDTVKIFVGHGAAFRHAACHLGVLQFRQLRQLSMHHCRPVLLEYLSGGNWRHLEGEWKIRSGYEAFTD
ncbi:MAG: histidine phosphatase family protein [Gammaproteobacteria bacterium]|jgi:2,3-bisphosphoglycerate-dependent phosphoglycerate mutase|nr:histidine phosphatase family protein [Gammaproteobacteria bacterium]